MEAKDKGFPNFLFVPFCLLLFVQPVFVAYAGLIDIGEVGNGRFWDPDKEEGFFQISLP
jgi:hypothetical protein